MQSSRRSLGPAVLAAAALATVPLLAAPRPAAAATTFIVTTATDPGTGTACPATVSAPCSLRAAITAANASTGAVLITFGVPGPFDVHVGTLMVNGGETLTIKGAADGSTAIDGGNAVRVLAVAQVTSMSCPTTTTALTLDHITVQNGHETTTTPGMDDGFGGGVDVNCGDKLAVVDSTFSNNSAQRGGGAINDNTASAVSVLRSTFTGNSSGSSATDGGGAIEVSTAAALTVVDSTFIANTTAFDGGAIFGVSGAAVTLVNDTITGNTAPSGMAGGIATAINGSTTATNTIVSGNAATNCGGTVTDSGHNAERGTSCGFSSHAINTDPLLGTLQANGGPTRTMALQPGSPAIDAGDDTACAAATTASPAGAGGLDQRGATRPQGAHCDVGAYEVVATTTALAAPSTATPGSSITLTATVTPGQALPGQPAGTVTFLDGTTVLGTGALGGGTPDTVAFTTTAPAAGAHTLTARYAATALFLGSTSAPVALTVTAPPTPTPNPTPAGGVAPIGTPNAGATPPAGGATALLGGGVVVGAVALVGRRRRRM